MKNVYFSQGTKSEQYLIEDLILESITIYGEDFFYIPRTLVSKDDILGEDRLSKFTSSFPIEMYFENVDSYDGQQAFISKFGLMMEQSATLVVARRRWEQLVGRYGQTIIPTRPCEGDLIFFPLTKGLFEIKFVTHQDPFYQLGKLYVYKLQVELFQYASERLETGIPDIDIFESIKTFSTDTEINPHGRVKSIEVTANGTGYTSAPTVTIVSSVGLGATATAVIGGNGGNKVVSIIVTNGGSGYTDNTTVDISDGGGSGATADPTIEIDIDKSDGFGNNNSFKDQSEGLLFDVNNPFGDVI